MDLDPVGADISGESQLTLNPASGLDPSRQVKYIPTAATAIYPNITAPLYASASIEENIEPKTVAPLAGIPVVRPPVDLAPPNPAHLAPRATDFSAQSRTPEPPTQLYPPVAQPPAQQYRPQAWAPGTNEGMLGTDRQVVPEYDARRNNLETAKKELQGRVDKMESDARSPFNQLWFGTEATGKLADEAVQKRLQIKQIDEALQKEKDIQEKGRNAGLSLGPNATENTIVNNLTKQMLSGEPVLAEQAAQKLTAYGHGDLVKGSESQMVAAMYGTFKYRQELQQRLDNAKTDAEYNEVKGKIAEEAKRAGVEIPKSRGEWEAKREQRLKAGNDAMVRISRYQTGLAKQQDYTPIPDEKLAEVHRNGLRMSNGTEVMPGTTAVQHLGQGNEGVADVYGSNNLRLYGAPKNTEGTYNIYGPAQKEATQKIMDAAIAKDERGKYAGLVRIYDGMVHDNDGKLLPKGEINTNPGMLQALAEVMTAEFRHGLGGANAGMMKLEYGARGWAQNTFDEMVKNFAGLKGVVSGKEGKYLTKLTQEQKRFVLEWMKNYTDKEVGSRLSGTAYQIGTYGGHLEDSGLERELQNNPTLVNARDRGRDIEVQYRSRLPAVVREHDRVYTGRGTAALAVPGASVNPLPASALPALYPELQVVPPAAAPPTGGGSPTVPGQPPSTPGGGGGSPFTSGAAPIPFTPGAPAAAPPAPAGPALRPLAATPAASLVQSFAPQPAAPAQLPSSWGAGIGNAPTAPTTPTPQAPGGPGTAATAPPPAVAAPQGARPGGTFINGVPSNGFPAHIANNSVARTVYGIAGQTAMNAMQNPNPTIATNAAIVATSSAQSESSFNPNTIHDGGIGYGLFGHNDNGKRLSGMQQHAGVPVTGKPGAPIPVNAQTSFYVREMSKAADTDPFIAQTLANSNASAEDLTRVQMRLERPQGYKGPGTEEQGHNWAARLANTRAAMGGGGVQTAAVAAAPPAAVATAAPAAGLLDPRNVRQALEQKTREVGAEETFRQAPNMAPAVLGTGGALVGGAVAGPPGAYAGGIAGGMVGGLIKNRYGPEENQTLGGTATDIGFGGATGAVSAIPGAGAIATSARVALSGAIPGFEAFAQGKDAGEIYDAAAMGLVGGAVGEGFGRALGAAGNAMWSGYSKATQAELISVGKTLAEQQPKVMNAAGKMVENPIYTKAMARAKQLGQDPDNLSHAWTTAEKDVASGARIPPDKGDALTQRPGQIAEARIGREQYDPIREEIATAPKPSPANAPTFAHDPEKIVGVHSDVPNTQAMRDAAAAAKLQMNQPASSWREIWDNQVKARSTMLALEREAIDKGEKVTGKGYRALADEVRNQQQHIAEKLLPPKQADALMTRLGAADEAYRRALIAGQNDIVKVVAAGGAKGREALAAFNQLAGDDPAAKAMMASLLKLYLKGGAKEAGKYSAAGVAMYIAAHFPGPGHAVMTGIGMNRGWQLFKDYMVLKGSGSTVKFGDLIRRNVSPKTVGKMSAGANVIGANAAPLAAEAMQ